MPYKISGSNSEESRIIVVDESDWSIEANEVTSAGNYEILDLSSGQKLVASRKADGETIAYGAVPSVYYEPLVDPNAGIVWNSRSSAADNVWTGVCWSPELSLFCAVAQSGSAATRVMTSSDGISWSTATAPELAWKGICWSPELSLFVAVSQMYTMYSSNGINWTQVDSTHNYSWHDVCWSPELSLFCSASNQGSMMISSNGINWTHSYPNKISGGSSVCWSPELTLFAAPSSTGEDVIISSDGVNWDLYSLPTETGSQNKYTIAWSPELSLFVTLGYGTMYSANGINWTLGTDPAATIITNACWSPETGLFVGVSNYGTDNRVVTSDDGMTWTNRTTPVDNAWEGVCWSPEVGRFVAVSSDGTGDRVMTSV